MNSKEQSKQPSQQQPFSQIPPELLYALLKANNGNIDASIDGVKEGLGVYRNKYRNKYESSLKKRNSQLDK